MREEVVRPRVEDYDADAGVADMINDYHEAQFAEGRTEEEPEATAKAFYDMFAAAPREGLGPLPGLASPKGFKSSAADGTLPA